MHFIHILGRQITNSIFFKTHIVLVFKVQQTCFVCLYLFVLIFAYHNMAFDMHNMVMNI